METAQASLDHLTRENPMGEAALVKREWDRVTSLLTS